MAKPIMSHYSPDVIDALSVILADPELSTRKISLLEDTRSKVIQRLSGKPDKFHAAKITLDEKYYMEPRLELEFHQMLLNLRNSQSILDITTTSSNKDILSFLSGERLAFLAKMRLQLEILKWIEVELARPTKSDFKDGLLSYLKQDFVGKMGTYVVPDIFDLSNMLTKSLGDVAHERELDLYRGKYIISLEEAGPAKKMAVAINRASNSLAKVNTHLKTLTQIEPAGRWPSKSKTYSFLKTLGNDLNKLQARLTAASNANDLNLSTEERDLISGDAEAYLSNPKTDNDMRLNVLLGSSETTVAYSKLSKQRQVLGDAWTALLSIVPQPVQQLRTRVEALLADPGDYYDWVLSLDQSFQNTLDIANGLDKMYTDATLDVENEVVTARNKALALADEATKKSSSITRATTVYDKLKELLQKIQVPDQTGSEWNNKEPPFQLWSQITRTLHTIEANLKPATESASAMTSDQRNSIADKYEKELKSRSLLHDVSNISKLKISGIFSIYTGVAAKYLANKAIVETLYKNPYNLNAQKDSDIASFESTKPPGAYLPWIKSLPEDNGAAAKLILENFIALGDALEAKKTELDTKGVQAAMKITPPPLPLAPSPGTFPSTIQPSISTPPNPPPVISTPPTTLPVATTVTLPAIVPPITKIVTTAPLPDLTPTPRPSTEEIEIERLFTSDDWAKYQSFGQDMFTQKIFFENSPVAKARFFEMAKPLILDKFDAFITKRNDTIKKIITPKGLVYAPYKPIDDDLIMLADAIGHSLGILIDDSSSTQKALSDKSKAIDNKTVETWNYDGLFTNDFIKESVVGLPSLSKNSKGKADPKPKDEIVLLAKAGGKPIGLLIFSILNVNRTELKIGAKDDKERVIKIEDNWKIRTGNAILGPGTITIQKSKEKAKFNPWRISEIKSFHAKHGYGSRAMIAAFEKYIDSKELRIVYDAKDKPKSKGLSLRDQLGIGAIVIEPLRFQRYIIPTDSIVLTWITDVLDQIAYSVTKSITDIQQPSIEDIYPPITTPGANVAAGEYAFALVWSRDRLETFYSQRPKPYTAKRTAVLVNNGIDAEYPLVRFYDMNASAPPAKTWNVTDNIVYPTETIWLSIENWKPPADEVSLRVASSVSSIKDEIGNREEDDMSEFLKELDDFTAIQKTTTTPTNNSDPFDALIQATSEPQNESSVADPYSWV